MLSTAVVHSMRIALISHVYIQDFSYMFSDALAFNKSLMAWDLASAINLEAMFAGAAEFNCPAITLAWSATATNLSHMFAGYGCTYACMHDINCNMVAGQHNSTSHVQDGRQVLLFETTDCGDEQQLASDEKKDFTSR